MAIQTEEKHGGKIGNLVNLISHQLASGREAGEFCKNGELILAIAERSSNVFSEWCTEYFNHQISWAFFKEKVYVTYSIRYSTFEEY